MRLLKRLSAGYYEGRYLGSKEKCSNRECWGDSLALDNDEKEARSLRTAGQLVSSPFHS